MLVALRGQGLNGTRNDGRPNNLSLTSPTLFRRQILFTWYKVARNTE